MKNNHVTINELSLEIKKENIKVLELLEKKLSTSYNDQEIIDMLSDIYKNRLFINAMIANKTLELMQLFDEDQNAKQVDLKGIGEMYKSLIKVSRFDIGIYESVYHFFDAVLDNPSEIKDYVLSGVKNIMKKARELEIYINESGE